MSEPVTARDHALRVAVLEALKDAVTKEYERARTEAEPVFAAKYTEEGNPLQFVLLPGGERISQITITTPGPVVKFRDGAVEDWAREHVGDGAFEEYLLPAAVDTRQVLEAVKAMHPKLVKTRLRPGTRTRLEKQAAGNDGWLEDKDAGVKEQVADVSPGTVTGTFAFTGKDADPRRARIMAELLGGDPVLREIVGLDAMLALPSPEGETDAVA